MIFIEYVQSLSDNPYFGTGFGLFGIGATLLKKGIQIGTVLFRCHVVIRERACKSCLSVETSFEQRNTGHVTIKYNFILSIGVHFFRYKENWIKIEGTGEQQTLDLHMGIPWETIQLTAFDKDRSIYFNILEEVEFVQIFTESHYNIGKSAATLLIRITGQMALNKHEGKTIGYTIGELIRSDRFVLHAMQLPNKKSVF